MKKSKNSLAVKSLALAVNMALFATASHAATPDTKVKKAIGDLEIYQEAKGGKVIITLMLDTSGSMTDCDMNGSRPYYPTKSNTTPQYDRYVCTNRWSGASNPDRLTRLKDAVFELMDDKTLAEDKISIGVGQFSTQSDDSNVLDRYGADGRTGKILVPAAPLSNTQRQKIKEAIAGLYATSGTPSAAAYAEVGAYMLGTTTAGSGDYSGFNNSVKTSKNGSNYISPLADDSSTCDGQGIYFLTDGEPNSASRPDRSMQRALGGTLPASYYNGDTLLRFPTAYNGSGWSEIGRFAKALRDSNNPKKRSIRTAVVGFGSVFDVSGTSGFARTLPVPELDKDNLPIPGKFTNKTATYYDCSKISTFPSVDARNACNWGAQSHPSLPGVGGYGEGGFYSASKTSDIVNSVKEFAGRLNNEIAATPSGTITVPDDPYSVSGQQAYAYLPMLEAKPSTTEAVWPGNMKKYRLKAGTVWGKNGNRLFKDAKGTFTDNPQDEWSTVTTGNSGMQVGGFYAQLTSPKAGLDKGRTVYIEDFTNATLTTPKMRKFGVDTNGKLTLDGKTISASNTFYDTTTYTLDNVKYLLHFLGFSQAKVGISAYDIDNIPAGTNFASITLQTPADEIRVLGASPHSAPTAVSYGAKLDSKTNNVSTDPKDRQDYVIFGSMDGALHMAEATEGKEIFAFIPKLMLEKQKEALRASGTTTTAGLPYFGVDAPWSVEAKYDFYPADGIPTEMKVSDDIYAYGGLRMGGNGLYALNLGKKLQEPQLAFVLNEKTTGGKFADIGQIWSKPKLAKIKKNAADTTGREVLIFGGGYDMCYENEDFQVGLSGSYSIANDQNGNACATKTKALGNTVYMVDAKTGAYIWSASHNDMKHSIVGGVEVIDRNNDGFIDSIYFADLGGQVFRADAPSEDEGIPNRVTRLMKPADSGTKYVRRFYEKPVLSVYQVADYNGGNNFILVSVASGDRSNPTSTMRDDTKYADRMYGIIDTDIGLPSNQFFGASATLTLKDSDNFVNLSGTPRDRAGKESKIAEVRKANGWFYPLSYFNGYSNVKYTKTVGKSEVIGSLLFSSVYNPDMKYDTTANDCSASVKGGSEYQMYCLPFGVCRNDNSRNGRGGFLPAGQGIRELTLGPLDNTASGSTKRVLISNVAVDGSTAGGKNGRIDFGSQGGSSMGDQTGLNATGGDGSMPAIVAEKRFTLQPLRWYDNSIKN